MKLENRDCIIEEASKIIKNIIGREDPNFIKDGRVPTLAESLHVLCNRYLTIPANFEITEDLLQTIEDIQEMLEEVDPKIIEKVCSDKIIRESLYALLNNIMDCEEIVKEIIEDIIASSEVATRKQDKVLHFLTEETICTSIKNLNIAENSESISLVQVNAETNPVDIKINQKSILSNGNSDTLNGAVLSTDNTESEKTDDQTVITDITMPAATLESDTNVTLQSQYSTLPLQMLSVKDALDFIPEFNGFNMTLRSFIDRIREVQETFPQIDESYFVKLIKLKLNGEALQSVRYVTLHNVQQMINYFNDLFGTGKTCWQLSKEMKGLRQDSDEKVISFSNRTKSLAQDLYEAAEREKKTSNKFIQEIEKNKAKFFIKGLHSHIISRVDEKVENLYEATVQAIKIERDFDVRREEQLKFEELRRSADRSQRNSECEGKVDISADSLGQRKPPVGQNDAAGQEERIDRRFRTNAAQISNGSWSRSTEQWRSSNPSEPASPKVCNYCKNSGHWISECRKLAYNNEKKGLSSQEKGQGFLKKDIA